MSQIDDMEEEEHWCQCCGSLGHDIEDCGVAEEEALEEEWGYV